VYICTPNNFARKVSCTVYIHICIQIICQTVYIGVQINALFVWLISHQPAALFSQNKPATSNQPAVANQLTVFPPLLCWAIPKQRHCTTCSRSSRTPLALFIRTSGLLVKCPMLWYVTAMDFTI
jgi:hypothetical protein